jgi:hypothetical protein
MIAMIITAVAMAAATTAVAAVAHNHDAACALSCAPLCCWHTAALCTRRSSCRTHEQHAAGPFLPAVHVVAAAPSPALFTQPYARCAALAGHMGSMQQVTLCIFDSFALFTCYTRSLLAFSTGHSFSMLLCFYSTPPTPTCSMMGMVLRWMGVGSL